MTTNTATAARTIARDALLALGQVHPHHVQRLDNETHAYLEGTLVRLTDSAYNGARFYTGLGAGSPAFVTRAPDHSGTGSASIQNVEDEGPHLAVYTPLTDLAVLDMEDYTAALAFEAAKRARTAANGLLEQAYASANRLLGAPATDDAALDALRQAHRVREFAFAMTIYAEYIQEAERKAETARIRAAR